MYEKQEAKLLELLIQQEALEVKIAAVQAKIDLHHAVLNVEVGQRVRFRRRGHSDLGGMVTGVKLGSTGVSSDMPAMRLRVAVGTGYSAKIVTVPAIDILEIL